MASLSLCCWYAVWLVPIECNWLKEGLQVWSWKVKVQLLWPAVWEQVEPGCPVGRRCLSEDAVQRGSQGRLLWASGGVWVSVGVSVWVGVSVGVSVWVWVSVGVSVWVWVSVGVSVYSTICVWVSVGVAVYSTRCLCRCGCSCVLIILRVV